MFDRWLNKPIIIFGLGTEGLSTYQYLQTVLPDNQYFLMDEKPLSDLNDEWAGIVAQQTHTTYLSTLDQIADVAIDESMLFKTPGIPVTHPFITELVANGATLYSNTQLFFELVAEVEAAATDSEDSPQLITIGVTGTKGKSTTTALIHHVLNDNGFQAYLAGNIGTPALTAWANFQQNQQQGIGLDTTVLSNAVYFVIELSSHQLAELPYSPHIAVVQNVVSEHLDYYENFEQYFSAKTAITRFQKTDDLVIFNQDSATATKIAALSAGNQLSFSLKEQADGYLQRTEDAHLMYRDQPVIAVKEVPLLGKHNLYNTLPAIMIGIEQGLAATDIASAIKSFHSLPHRIELVATVRGIKYYDDSIATNPAASQAAIEAFANQPMILLAGGYERHQDFSQLAQVILNHQVKAIALFPPTGSRLLEELKKANAPEQLLAATKLCQNMTEAVTFATKHATSGDVVLLSPAAASFGIFNSYKDRGDQFKKEVQKLVAR